MRKIPGEMSYEFNTIFAIKVLSLDILQFLHVYVPFFLFTVVMQQVLLSPTMKVLHMVVLQVKSSGKDR